MARFLHFATRYVQYVKDYFAQKWSASFISQPSFFHKADLRSSPFPAPAEGADRESRNLQLFSVPFPATPPAAPEKETERKMPFPASPLRTDESPFSHRPRGRNFSGSILRTGIPSGRRTMNGKKNPRRRKLPASSRVKTGRKSALLRPHRCFPRRAFSAVPASSAHPR